MVPVPLGDLYIQIGSNYQDRLDHREGTSDGYHDDST